MRFVTHFIPSLTALITAMAAVACSSEARLPSDPDGSTSASATVTVDSALASGGVSRIEIGLFRRAAGTAISPEGDLRPGATRRGRLPSRLRRVIFAGMNSYTFLVETYATERFKTLSVWTHFTDADLGFRPEPRARTPLEQMVHQCVSEDVWMQRMLGIDADLPPLPERENRLGFLEHYASASERRLEQLNAKPAEWFAGETRFFDVPRSRAWVLTRRIAHSAHHRGQLTTYLRLLGRDLYSTYGPTADTGGLFQQGAPVIYRYRTVEELLVAARGGSVESPRLPGPGSVPPTERPR